MIPSSAYLNELLHLRLTEDSPRGLQLWSDLFDQNLQRWDLDACQRLLREIRRLDLETEIGATAFVLHKTGKGTLAAHTGDLETSARIYEGVLDSLPEAEFGWILMNLGNIHYLSRHFEQALHFYSRARDVYLKENFLPGQARVLTNLGCAQRDSGDFAGAIQSFQQAFGLIPSDDIETQVINLCNWANTLHISGQLEAAGARYQDALRLLTRLDAPHLRAQITGNLGVLFLDQGNTQQAIELLSQDLSTQREMGDFLGQAEALNNLGMAYHKDGQISLALDCYRRSAEIKNNLGDQVGELTSLRNYGIVAEKHKLPIPQEILARAVQLADGLGDSETLEWLRTFQTGFYEIS